MAQNLNLNLKVLNVQQLRAALDPIKLALCVRLEKQLQEAQTNLNEALEKQQKIQGYVAQKATTDDERRIKALRTINAQMESLNQQLALEDSRKAYGQVVEKAVAAEDRRLAALRVENSELERQEQHLANINAKLNPGTLQKRIANQLKSEEGQRGLHFAETKERTKQLGFGRGLLDLFNIPDVSKTLGTVGGKLSGLGASLSGKGGLAGAAGGLLGKAGGALASAAAGPIGLIVAGATALTPVIKKLAGAPFKVITAGMGAINNALQGLTGSLGPIGSILGGIQGYGSMLKSFGDAFGPAGIVLSVMGGAIEGITKQVTEFLNVSVQLAAKAQPGVVKRFQIALDDTAAVIGHRLVPVVELMTSVVRGIGDLLQTMLPNTKEFRGALAPLAEVWTAVKDALAPVAFLIKYSLIVGLRMLTPQLQLFSVMIQGMLAPLINLARLSGLDLETSVGAAARQVKFTNPESYAKEVYAAAAGSGVNPAKQTADNTGQMVGLLQDILIALPGAYAPASAEGLSPAAAALTAAGRGWLNSMLPGAGALLPGGR